MNTPLSALPAPPTGPRRRRRLPSPRCLYAENLYAENLYAENLRLVGLCLSRFPSLTADAREDAYTAGLLGLWSAAQGFDPSLGFQFSTYAARTIRGFILHHLKEDSQQQRLSCVSLETPLGEGGEGGELGELIANTQAEKPGQKALDEAGFEALLSRLPARQQDVLRGVYGQEIGLPEMADAWGVSRQRVHQLHAAALQTLRKQQRASGGRV